MTTSIAPQIGQRIRLIAMPCDPDPIAPGTCGVIREVSYDRPPWHPDVVFTVDVNWENGRRLFLLGGVDSWEIVEDTVEEKPYSFWV